MAIVCTECERINDLIKAGKDIGFCSTCKKILEMHHDFADQCIPCGQEHEDKEAECIKCNCMGFLDEHNLCEGCSEQFSREMSKD